MIYIEVNQEQLDKIKTLMNPTVIEGVVVPYNSLYYYSYFTAEHLSDYLEIPLEQAQQFLDDTRGGIASDLADDAVLMNISEAFDIWKERQNINNNN